MTSSRTRTRSGVMASQLTADGDHPSVEGYRLLGELVASELESVAD